MTKLETRLLHLPPFLAYSLCRVKNPPITNADIRRREKARLRGAPQIHHHCYRRITRAEFAAKSGINERTVERLVQRVNWVDKDFTVDHMLRFLRACEIDLMRIEPVTKQLRTIAGNKKKFAHLSKHQMNQFEKRSREYSRYLEKVKE